MLLTLALRQVYKFVSAGRMAAGTGKLSSVLADPLLRDLFDGASNSLLDVAIG